MSKGVELTEKELKEVVGGAYIKDGYVYYQVKGQNGRKKILGHEDTVKEIIENATAQGLSDEQILLIFAYNRDYLGAHEDC